MFESQIDFVFDIYNYLSWEKIKFFSVLVLPPIKKGVKVVREVYSQRKISSKAISFNDEQEFWASILGSQFHEKHPANTHKIHDSQLVQFKDFTISEWVPWAPGRYWTKDGFKIRLEPYKYIEYESKGRTIFSPKGKSCATLGGLGTLRFDKIKLDDNEYKLLSLTTSLFADRAIPILVEDSIYRDIRNKISDSPTIKADILGIYTRVPRQILPIFRYFENIDKGITVVDNNIKVRNTCKNIREGNSVKITPWTIFAHRNDDGVPYAYDSCFYSDVDSSDEDAIINASKWIEKDYVNRHNGKILTEFDEYTNRFSNTALPLSDVMSGQYEKLRIVMEEFLNTQKDSREEQIPDKLKRELVNSGIPYHQ